MAFGRITGAGEFLRAPVAVRVVAERRAIGEAPLRQPLAQHLEPVGTADRQRGIELIDSLDFQTNLCIVRPGIRARHILKQCLVPETGPCFRLQIFLEFGVADVHVGVVAHIDAPVSDFLLGQGLGADGRGVSGGVVMDGKGDRFAVGGQFRHMDHAFAGTRGQAAQCLHAIRLARHADFHPGIHRLAAVVFDGQFGFGFQDAGGVDDPRALGDVGDNCRICRKGRQMSEQDCGGNDGVRHGRGHGMVLFQFLPESNADPTQVTATRRRDF